MGTISEARRILDRLVAFPTVSRDSNLALVDWVEDYLAGHGVAAHRVYNADRTKANLWASVGPDVAGGVILSGHTDVVPVDGQDWSSDPWTVTERNGRLYGRGTCDMKGFDALALAAVPLALAAGVKRPLQIALSIDEEIGCAGCIPMVGEMAATAPKAAAVIVGEPSRMRVVTGHKGGIGFGTRLKGFPVHSSMMHEGVNAIMEAAKLIGWANARNAENRARPPGPLATMFDPPWTTVHVGQIEGGTAHNITAEHCRMGLDFRVVPGEEGEDWATAYEAMVAEVAAGMKAVRPEAGIELIRQFDVPPLVPEADGNAERLARALTGDNGTHVVSYGTEAGHFQKAGYSAVVCGPGDIAQAHQADEFIEVSEFEAGWRFMQGLVAELAR
ncbi:acetylornithine deacetylase [Defluviimonas sp. SAOS-178_SWC]|uniref:acetylornithine deacetylase n=1 Tax=Defluviimonas sp. SAOS-178_SWC TaxID=3121287 RepID=UPI0032218679